MRTRLLLIAIAVLVLSGTALAGEDTVKLDENVVMKPADGATVAVLAFKNLCGDATLDWLGVGFAESLSTKLSNVSGIQLVERTRLADAMKELKLQDTGIVDANTAGKLGKIIGAKYVIVGSFQKAGDSLKADARRVEVETSVASNGVEATGDYAKVFDVQSDLAIKLASAFGGKITEEVKQVMQTPETTSVTAYELNAKGLKQGNSGNFDEASSNFTKAIEADPKYAEAYYNRGLVRFYRADYQGAESDLNKAIELDPKDPMAYVSRGICWMASMNYVQGMADLNKAIEVAPNDYRGYGARALVYMNAGNATMALTDVNKVISLNPKLPEAYFSRAMCNLALGRTEGVSADIEKGRALGGTPPPQLTQALSMMDSFSGDED